MRSLTTSALAKVHLPSLPTEPLRRERLRQAVLGAAIVVAIVVPLLRAFAGMWPDASDAHAYWAARLDHLYAISEIAAKDAYFYSPAFAQAIASITAILSFPLFVGLWTALLMAALVAMAGPWSIPLVLFTPVLNEVILGNVHLLIGFAVAFGFRWPALWSFVLLTKVAPGVGLLWFAVRREWRPLGIALGTTAAIAAVSFLLAPRLWVDWFLTLAANRDAVSGYAFLALPIWVRLPLAMLLVAWGARTDRRWTVVVAAWLALPISWSFGLSVLVGVIPLVRIRWSRSAPRVAASEEGAPA